MNQSWLLTRKGISRWIAAGVGLDVDRVYWVGQGGARPPSPWISVKVMSTRSVGSDQDVHRERPIEFDDADVEAVDIGANAMQVTEHEYTDGDGPIRFTTTGVLPSPLQLATDYWLLVVDDNTIRLATSRAAATDEPPVAIDILDAGSGTHTISSTDDTRRVLEEIVMRSEGHRVATLSVQCYADSSVEEDGAEILERLRNSFRLSGQQQRLRTLGVAVGTMSAVTNVGGSTSSAAALEPRAVMTVTMNYVDGAEEFGTTIESIEGELKVMNGDEEVATLPFVFQRDG